MRALVLTGKNEPLILQEKSDLTPGEGEVIIRVHAAALNHRDVWIQKGQYAGLKYPITPGSDGSGVVVNDPTGTFTGKEVIVNPAIHWGGALSHQDPKDFRILGLPDDGTFAEFVKVPLQNIVERPAHLSFEEAAALPLAGVTAFRSVSTRARVQSGEKVLIPGLAEGWRFLPCNMLSPWVRGSMSLPAAEKRSKRPSRWGHWEAPTTELIAGAKVSSSWQVLLTSSLTGRQVTAWMNCLISPHLVEGSYSTEPPEGTLLR